MSNNTSSTVYLTNITKINLKQQPKSKPKLEQKQCSSHINQVNPDTKRVNMYRSKSQENIDNSNKTTKRLIHLPRTSFIIREHNKYLAMKGYPPTIYQRFFQDIDKIKQHTANTIDYLKKKEITKSTSCAKKRSNSPSNHLKRSDHSPRRESPDEDNNENQTKTSNQKKENYNSKQFRSLGQMSSTNYNTTGINSIYNSGVKHGKARYRQRCFKINFSDLERKSSDLYECPAFLREIRIKIKDPHMQHLCITDKAKLIQDNLDNYKSNFMFSTAFYRAFMNFDEPQKILYNKLIEQICGWTVVWPPLLMAKFYDSLNAVLYCPIPNLHEEQKHQFKNENVCLKLNYKFWLACSNYYASCMEVLNVLCKKIGNLRYSQKDFYRINIYLDALRMNTSNWWSFIKIHTDKNKTNVYFITRFEEDSLIRKHKDDRLNDEVRRRLRSHKKNFHKEENDKFERINNALDLKKRTYNQDFMEMKWKIEKEKSENSGSLLNSNLVSHMMKYIDKSTREKIIAWRVVERYRDNELNELKLIEGKKSGEG